MLQPHPQSKICGVPLKHSFKKDLQLSMSTFVVSFIASTKTGNQRTTGKTKVEKFQGSTVSVLKLRKLCGCFHIRMCTEREPDEHLKTPPINSMCGVKTFPKVHSERNDHWTTTQCFQSTVCKKCRPFTSTLRWTDSFFGRNLIERFSREIQKFQQYNTKIARLIMGILTNERETPQRNYTKGRK